MRVIITAGGTGGHIYPALAIIDKIKEKAPDSEILYIGTHNRMEKDIIPARNIKYEALKIYGFSKKISIDLEDIILIPKAYFKCLKLMKKFKPDIVIGVGGYVTFPVIRAAHKLGIKTFIHEQNSIPGKANKALIKYVDLVGVSFPNSKEYFKNTNCIVTGNPTASNAIYTPTINKEKYGLAKEKPGVLIVNGSLGSASVNQKMEEFLKTIGNESYEVLYITGKSYYDNFKKINLPSNVFIEPYIDNLAGLMKSIDIIVTRAGASSLAEITTLGIPCILIPSPYVANNHQYYNAKSIVDSKAGLMIEESNLTSDLLKENINKLINDKSLYLTYKENLTKLSTPNSADIIYDAIKDLIDNK